MVRLRATLGALLFFVLAANASAIIIYGREGHALLPLAGQQVGRIYVTNIGNPDEGNLVCGVIVNWLAADGSVIGDPGEILEVRPQATRFVDFFDRTLAAAAVGRRTVRAVIELDPRTPPLHPCIVQEAVVDIATGHVQFLGNPVLLPEAVQPPPEPE